MRIGGLASGIDTDELIKKLMTAERMPLDKMQQQSQKLTWQRDGFRDVNKALKELDDMLSAMSRSQKYKTKSISSTQEGAVTATGAGNATDGTYEISVSSLARSAMLVSQPNTKIDPNKTMQQMGFTGDKVTFQTYKEGSVDPVNHEISVKASDTINDVLKNITKADNNVRAFYDESSNKVIMETTRTGKYNKAVDGKEITFPNSGTGKGSEFFNDILGFGGGDAGTVTYTDATDATFIYNNGLKINSHDNNYQLNGIKFEFKDVTTNGTNATLTVKNDTEGTFKNIMEFVDKYNEVIEKINKTQQEERYRKFPPLTDEQKKDMTEDQIKKWEEKAKSGMLKGEASITNGLQSMRTAFYSTVKTDGSITSLTQIGLETSSSYMDGGKIVLSKNSEDKLKQTLQEDPDGVMRLFTFSSDNKDERGLVQRLRKSIEDTVGTIEKRAGKPSDTAEKYTLGKNMKDLDKRISDFERRLVAVETRYWNQFNAMEKAISRLNNQSSQLLSQFGG